MQLIESLGFDAVDAGGLDESWRQQPGSPCYTSDFTAPELTRALASAQRDRVPEYRKAADDAARACWS
jgi:predicted dinucleotide-binding enzyme